MRLVHFQHLRSICFALFFLLSDPFAIYNKSPHEGNAKNNQQQSVDPVNNMNIMWRKPVSYFTRQENFQYVCPQHPDKTGCKGNNFLIERKVNDNGGCIYPKNEYGGVQCIHEIAGQKYFGIVPFTEFKYLLPFFIHFYFLKK